MSRTPILYRLEGQRSETAMWLPILDTQHQPITFSGQGSKARALTMAELMCRWPSYHGVRVKRNSEVLKTWTKQGGVSA